MGSNPRHARATGNKRCNAKGDYPVTLHRCFNPKPHAGTGAQPSSLCCAV